jgi:hypothetical protein
VASAVTPLAAWTGWDVRGGAPAGPRAVEAFTRAAPPDDSPDAHYELLAVAGRGFRPPRFLSTVHLETVHLEEDAAPAGEPEPADPSLRATWSLVYRRIAETGPQEVAPFAIYLLGVDPPVGATEEELAVFNEFYTGVHLPEVAERRHALRAVRYELEREVRAPYRPAPRFLAVYEVDEASASNRRHTGPPYSKGPEVWQRHTTPWRLWYTRLGP